jgi:hypothetical protein
VGVCLAIVGGLEAAGRAGIDDSIERIMPGVRVGTGGSARGGTGGIVSTGLPCDCSELSEVFSVFALPGEVDASTGARVSG